MGLFGGGGPSRKEIELFVQGQISSRLGSPDQVGDGQFAKNYEELLRFLANWAQENKLGMWKRSVVCGTIEAALASELPRNVVSPLALRARKAIISSM